MCQILISMVDVKIFKLSVVAYLVDIAIGKLCMRFKIRPAVNTPGKPEGHGSSILTTTSVGAMCDPNAELYVHPQNDPAILYVDCSSCGSSKRGRESGNKKAGIKVQRHQQEFRAPTLWCQLRLRGLLCA